MGWNEAPFNFGPEHYKIYNYIHAKGNDDGAHFTCCPGLQSMETVLERKR